VLRPIDSNLSILNSEQRANQIKDPSAHHVQTLQQDEVSKRIEHEKQSVLPADKSDEDVKVKDRRDDRRKEEGRGGKKRNPSPESDAPDDGKGAKAVHTGGLDFLA
jgi:hypothetical protein